MTTRATEIQACLSIICERLYTIILSETVIPLADEFNHLDLPGFLAGPVNNCLLLGHNEFILGIMDYFYDAELFVLPTDTDNCFFLDNYHLIKDNLNDYVYPYPFFPVVLKRILLDGRMQSILNQYFANINNY